MLIPFFWSLNSISQESIRLIEFEMSERQENSAERQQLINSITITYDSLNFTVVSSDSINTAPLENIKLDTNNNTLTFSQASSINPDITIYYEVSGLSKSKVKAKANYEDEEISFKGYNYKYCTNHSESHACRFDKVQECARQNGCKF